VRGNPWNFNPMINLHRKRLQETRNLKIPKLFKVERLRLKTLVRDP